VMVCDDADPCTVDSCAAGSCVFTDGRVDADGDGAFAQGTSADPKAALGCGKDCDDTNPKVFPGAPELCDSFDNDCNGVVDDNTGLTPTRLPPVLVSGTDASSADAVGLAYDGQGFGASMTLLLNNWQGHFRPLDAQGQPLAPSQRVAHVNAQSYGGDLLWTGERYLTAYEDARQDRNYEIYFDVLNRQGQRLIEDLRVTKADDFSVSPTLVWTGVEALLVWDDRRFENQMEGAAIFGQRVSADGALIGGNLRLTAPGVQGEAPSIALSKNGVGIAFTSLSSADEVRVRFMTASRTLATPSAAVALDFTDPDGPVVTALGDKYVVTFHQEGTIIGPSIYGAVLSADGKLEVAPRAVTSGATHARGHATYGLGDRFLLVWADDRDGSYQLYAQTFDQTLTALTQRQRITFTGTDTVGPAIAPASDGGLGVLYTDEGTGVRRAFFTRLDCAPTR